MSTSNMLTDHKPHALSSLARCRNCRTGPAAAAGASAVPLEPSSVWDGSIFDVAQRLESAEGFGPPLANGGAPTGAARSAGVSFAPLQTATSTPQAQRQGSGAAPPLRSALRRPQNSVDIGVRTTAGDADVAASPDASRERLTTEDGNALEPQPLLQGRRGSPRRAEAAGMRQRGSSYDTSPSSSGSGGADAAEVDSQEDVLEALPHRFVSELLPSTARGPASADAAAAVGSLHADADAEAGHEAALPVQPDSPSAQRLALRRRTSDLIQLSDTGEPRRNSSAAVAADDASLTQRAEAHYKECGCAAYAF